MGKSITVSSLTTGESFDLKDHQDDSQGCVAGIIVLDENRIASRASADAAIKIWNLTTKKCSTMFRGDHAIEDFALIGTYIVIITSDSMQMWSTKKDSPAELVYDYNPVHMPRKGPSIVDLGDGYMAAVTREGRTIGVWDVNNMQQPLVQEFIGHEGIITCLAKVADHYIASGSDDKTLKLWHVRSSSCIANIDHNYSINSIINSGGDLTYGIEVPEDNSSGLTTGTLRVIKIPTLEQLLDYAYKKNKKK